MKNPICFVAGTMILTTMGLKAIETIQAGDQVIATNPYTFQTEEKKVVETYINKTTCMVNIVIQDEVICTTMNHPFYVKGQGFVSAGKLSIGDEIMNASGGSYPVECIEFEENQETVYNFQVEDYHTYYVGEGSLLVHNDCPEGEAPTEEGSKSKPNQVHHYATNKSKTYTPQLKEIAKKYGLDLDDTWNKDLLPHQGRHPNAYHEYVLDSMKQFDEIAQGDKSIFIKLYDNLKNNVKSDPDMLYKDYWK